MSGDVVVVAGALAQQPARAGHAWVFLNWMLSFRSLGYRVLFVDRMNSDYGDPRAGVRWVADVMAAHDFDDAWSIDLGQSLRLSAGLSADEVAAAAQDAILLNVMGYLDDPELLGRFSRRILLDIDPGFGQAWQQSRLASLFGGHDAYATVGLNVGAAGCGVPDLGLTWIPTLPPVDLDAWSCSDQPSGSFTTIASWRGPFAPVAVDGSVFGLRAHQARQHAGLPNVTGAALEMALDIDGSDAVDRQLLIDGGWQLRDPRSVSSDIHSYRSYIHDSFAEFSVAKQVYVGLRTGWFSDRSACYLASGRPVIVSDTGLATHLPIGEGLLVYTTPDEAAEAVRDVAADPERHAKSATAIAAEFFDGATVARSLLERAA